MKTILKTEALTKKYGTFTAVSELSLTVNQGEIYGFIGLNGAGKTTTIRMLLGMIKPNSGKAFINEKVVGSRNTSIWNKVGYMVEAPCHYPNLTVKENLGIIQTLRQIEDKNSIGRVMDFLNISQYSNRKAKDLSQGNSQRLGIAKALIHDPEIILLDEPTNALDPSGIVEIRNLLKHLSTERGVTIFVSSHILGEVAKFSTTIGILHNGVLMKEMSNIELEKECAKRLSIHCQEVETTQNFLATKGIKSFLTDEMALQLTDQKIIEHPTQLIELLVHEGLTPTSFTMVSEDLESYFLKTIKSSQS